MPIERVSVQSLREENAIIRQQDLMWSGWHVGLGVNEAGAEGGVTPLADVLCNQKAQTGDALTSES